MFRVLSPALALCLLLSPLTVSAQDTDPARANRLCDLQTDVPLPEGIPPRREQLVMQDNLLTLWSMGLMKSAPMDQKTLCRSALFFLILSEGSACGKDREEEPGFFKGMPEEYRGYVPRGKVEETARNIFGQETVRHIAPAGTAFDGQGYFLDFSALSSETGNLCNVSADDLLPGFADAQVVEAKNGRDWEMFGTLRRFKYVDGGEIVWREAVFRAILHYEGETLQIKEFVFEEQAMG